jgi:hypothetical protein
MSNRMHICIVTLNSPEPQLYLHHDHVEGTYNSITNFTTPSKEHSSRKMQALIAFPDYHLLPGMKLHCASREANPPCPNGIDCLNSLAHQADQKAKHRKTSGNRRIASTAFGMNY